MDGKESVQVWRSLLMVGLVGQRHCLCVHDSHILRHLLAVLATASCLRGLDYCEPFLGIRIRAALVVADQVTEFWAECKQGNGFVVYVCHHRCRSCLRARFDFVILCSSKMGVRLP